MKIILQFGAVMITLNVVMILTCLCYGENYYMMIAQQGDTSQSIMNRMLAEWLHSKPVSRIQIWAMGFILNIEKKRMHSLGLVFFFVQKHITKYMDQTRVGGRIRFWWLTGGAT